MCIGLAMAVGAVPVAAFELFGIKFFEDQAEEDAEAVIVDPQPYFVTFTSSEGGAVEAALRNASALLADEAEPASGAAGLIAKARGDYRRLLAALYGEGHYGGAVSIRVFGGTEVPDAEWDVAARRLVESLKRAAPRAAERRIGLNIENHDGTMADTAARTSEIWQRAEEEVIGIVYDPANLMRDGKEGFPESLAIQAKAIRLVHVKDYRFVPGSPRRGANEASRRSVPVGEGDVPWTNILRTLAAQGYDGDLTFEYEMRWVPEQLPPTPIGVARSRDFVAALYRTFPS